VPSGDATRESTTADWEKVIKHNQELFGERNLSIGRLFTRSEFNLVQNPPAHFSHARAILWLLCLFIYLHASFLARKKHRHRQGRVRVASKTSTTAATSEDDEKRIHEKDYYHL
jgi:lipopolysaccharide export LptBFGC system permease protein LptF